VPLRADKATARHAAITRAAASTIRKVPRQYSLTERNYRQEASLHKSFAEAGRSERSRSAKKGATSAPAGGMDAARAESRRPRERACARTF